MTKGSVSRRILSMISPGESEPRMGASNGNSVASPDRPVLLSKEEVKRALRIGEAAFAELGVAYVQLGKRRRYVMDDVMTALARRKHEVVCRYARGRGRHSGGTTSLSRGIGFEEALKQPT